MIEVAAARNAKSWNTVDAEAALKLCRVSTAR
jgi:hypothetical protein